MKTTELFYPEVRVDMDGYTFTEGVQLEVSSSKTSYFDWASIRFTKEFQDAISIHHRASAQISLGYDGALTRVFTGYVVQPYNEAASADEIMLRDKMILLEDTPITCTFRSATPQEIIRYCLGVAGITDMRLASTSHQVKATVPIVRKSVIEVIEEVHRLWGIAPTFYFAGGVFYWGVSQEQSKIYAFEYGVNILDLKRAGGVWRLETVSAPMIRHSHVIDVVHPKVSGRFEVESVRYTTNDSGFLRTHLTFEGAA